MASMLFAVIAVARAPLAHLAGGGGGGGEAVHVTVTECVCPASFVESAVIA